MALDKMAQDTVNETMKALQEAPFTHDAELRITPRRMRALILFSQQRMNVQMNGKLITLIEESDAPELAEEIARVLTPVEDVPDEDAPTPEELAAVRDLRALRKSQLKS